MRNARTLALRALVIAIIAIAGVYFFRGMDWRTVGASFASANLPLVAFAATLNLGQVWVRALCFKVMLLPVGSVKTGRLVRYNLGMYAGNNLLPGRAGELVRIYLLKSREGVPASASVAVALVEKIFDVIALLLLALPLPLLLPDLPTSVSTAMWSLGGAGVLGLVATFLVSRQGRIARPGVCGGGADYTRFQRFAHGLSSVRRPGLFCAALALSLVAYLIDAAEVAVCLRAVGIHTHYAAPVFILLGIAVVLCVPSTPGSIGALELGAVAALHILGVDGERALAFSLIYHLMQIVPTTLLGLDAMRLAAAGDKLESPSPVIEVSRD